MFKFEDEVFEIEDVEYTDWMKFNDEINSLAVISFEASRECIKSEIDSLSAPQLFHITHASNLNSIFKHGLISRRRLSELKIDFAWLDEHRHDYVRDGVSITLGEANMPYAANKMNANKHLELVVVALSSEALSTLPFIAFPGNASEKSINRKFKERPHLFVGCEGLRQATEPIKTADLRNKNEDRTRRLIPELMFIETVSPIHIAEIFIPWRLKNQTERSIERLANAHNVPIKFGYPAISKWTN